MRISLQQAGNLFLLLVAIGYLYEGRGLQLWRGDTPGGRFFPLLLGICLLVIAIALLIREGRQPAADSSALQWRVPTAVALTLGICMFILPIVGYGIGCALLVLACFRIYEPHSWRADFLGALAAGVALHLVFVVLLPLEMPTGVLGF